ncbi:hypothetical protein GBAR_LOCUS28408 [Geodia barretti]|uniref:Fibronectin type-III domain-containing protein n=1 Tax=Geodia barretti TaxID=519541 RepID=A0AA35XHR4_GEOBA|nr:hypothetical protein GBAR_LOCUS28408 [Geodia barretti]
MEDTCSPKLFLASLLVIGLSLPMLAQEIFRAPENTTVYLDQSVVFTCEARSSLSSWLINGTLPEHLPSGTISDLYLTSTNTDEGNRLLTLNFPAKAWYNTTRVQCITRTLGGSSAESNTATLMIQGPLSAVTVLSSISNASSVTISWSAPFSLDVTGVDPDIWYSVLIYNVTDENNPTAILCTDCINITETHYTFTPDYLSPCHVYNFSVIPLNGAGQGENTYLTSSLHEYTLSDHRYLSDHEANITVFKKPRNVFQLMITAQLFMINNTVLCFQKHFKLYYNSSTQEQCPSVVSVVSPELTPGDIWLIQSEVVLKRDCNYTVHVASPSEALDSSRIFSINTRVVRVEVGELEGEVVVRCVFRHTLSQRCYVQLVSSEVEGGFQEGGCVEGEGEGVHRFPGLLPATYTVLVYGLVAGEGGLLFSSSWRSRLHHCSYCPWSPPILCQQSTFSY